MKRDKEKRKQKIVEYLRDGSSFAVSCAAVRISRTTGYVWRSEDLEFDAAVQEAMDPGLPEDPLGIF